MRALRARSIARGENGAGGKTGQNGNDGKDGETLLSNQQLETLGPALDRPPDERCLRCDAALADQEWCLECGAARTLIHRPPDWRVPVAVIATVIGLVLAAFVIALIELSGSRGGGGGASAAVQPTVSGTRSGGAPGLETTSATAKAAPRASSGAAGSSSQAARLPGRGFPGWPIGLSAWTVVLQRSQTRSEAAQQAAAGAIAAARIPVGILKSSLHPGLTPGYWLVFSGRYPTSAAAQARAATLVAKGLVAAHVVLVERSGR